MKPGLFPLVIKYKPPDLPSRHVSSQLYHKDLANLYLRDSLWDVSTENFSENKGHEYWPILKISSYASAPAQFLRCGVTFMH